MKITPIIKPVFYLILPSDQFEDTHKPAVERIGVEAKQQNVRLVVFESSRADMTDVYLENPMMNELKHNGLQVYNLNKTFKTVKLKMDP